MTLAQWIAIGAVDEDPADILPRQIWINALVNVTGDEDRRSQPGPQRERRRPGEATVGKCAGVIWLTWYLVSKHGTR